jgi:hypothetical protein
MRTAFVLIGISLVLLSARVSAEGELPTPTDEEKFSEVAPEHMWCDACAGSLFHIWWKLKKAHRGNFKRILKEYEVMEIIDDACMPRTFATTYGTKKVGDRHHLSGDGLKWFSHPSPTVGTLEPGKWLTAMCREIQGEIGEEELYAMFRHYHVMRGLTEKSDVAMFRKICVNTLKRCTAQQGLETYDGHEEADLKIDL